MLVAIRRSKKEEGKLKKLAVFLFHGTVAEWLGRALQKLVQRFESARCLF